MHKTLIILRHEFLSLVSKPTFWIGLFAVPLISGAIMLVVFISGSAALAVTMAQRNAVPERPYGVVDMSGLLAQTPQVLAEQPQLRSFVSEAEARVALGSDQISGFYLVDRDYLDNGDVRFVSKQFSPFEDLNKTDSFRDILHLALLKGDVDQVKRLDKPVNITARKSLAPTQARGGFGGEFSPVPFAIGFAFFLTLISSASYLMQTVTVEKENRVMEVLMSSASAVQLLTGKIMGLGLLGFIQLLLWLLSGLSLVRFIPVIEQYVGPLPIVAILWGVVYFIGGYFIYASLMAGLGALMPGGREAGQYVFFIMIPLLIPMWLNSAITSDIDGLLATGLSLFPLTSPVVMPMRLVEGGVPPWQILLGLVLLSIGVIAAVVLVARLFRAQSLLSGSTPTFKQVIAAFR